jgi:hypothetical protein
MEIVQDGLSRKVTVTELSAGIGGLDADFVTLSLNAQLPNERVLTAGTDISIVDGGPGGTITINAVIPTPPAGNLPVPTVNGSMLFSDGATAWLEAVDLAWDTFSVAGANTMDLASGVTQGATPMMRFSTIAPSARMMEFRSTASTNYEIFRCYDQTVTQYFNMRHDYSLSSSNHRLHVEHTGNADILTFVNNGDMYFAGQFDILFDRSAQMLKIGNSYHIQFDERASIASVGAGDGAIYVRNDTPNVLIFKDENDTEWVLNTAGGGTLAALTDVDLTGQAQYDLLFNVDGSNWEDTAGDLIFDVAAQALQFAAGFGINMGATPTRVLEMASSGLPSTTIEHTTVEVIAEVSTSSNSEVDVTGGVLPLLTEGDDYLIMGIAQHHQGNTGGENVHGADIAIASQAGVPLSNCRDDIEPPACAVASDQGAWFTGMNGITYTAAAYGQIRLEHSAGTAQTHYVNNASLMAFNLTDFGTENVDWWRDVTAPFVTVTDAGWSNLSPSVTIGDGVSDWLIFGTFQCDQPQAGGQIQFGLFDGSVNTEYAMHQFADVADIKSIVFSAVLTGIASTTFQTAARAVAASGDTARIFTSGLHVLRLNRFAQYSIQSASGPTSPGSGAEFSLLTDSMVANSNSDWGIFAFVRNQWIGNTLSGTSYGRANINAGGFTTIAGFDTPPQAVVENATNELTPRPLVPRITELTGVVATDTVGAELRWIPPATFGPTRAALYHMVMFTWDTFDSSVNATTLGDPTVDTQIDGAAVNLFGEYSFPLLDGAAGEGLVTDGLGQLSFAAASIPDPLILGSINLTSALSTSTLGAPYTNVPINIGNSLTGTQGMTQLSRQRIQTKPSAFSFNSTLFINIDGAGTSGSDTYIGGLNSAGIEVEFGVAVRLQHGLASSVVLETITGGVLLPDGSLYVTDKAAQGAFTAGRGEFWARNDSPSTPMFTTDTGVDIDLSAGAASSLQATMAVGATTTIDLQIITGAALTIFDAADSDSVSMEINTTTMAPAEAFVFTASVNVEVYSFDEGINIDGGDLNLGSAGDINFYRYGDAVSSSMGDDGTDIRIQVVGGTSTFFVQADSIRQSESASPAPNIAGRGQWWTRSAAPCRPMYTDDTDVDQEMDPSRSDLNTQNGNYTFLMTDKGKTIYKASGGAGETYTIPASGAVAYQIGTWIAIDNDGGGNLSIAITTDTLVGTDGATGTRTLGDNHRALIQKIGATRWRYQATDL